MGSAILTSVSEPFERRFGPHFLRSESNNTYRVVFDGDVTGKQLGELFTTVPPDMDPNACTLMLVDVRKLGTVRPAATHGHKPAAPKETSYLAYIGATFTARVMTNMFINAIQLLAGRKWIVYAFFDDEARARAWLAEMRQKDEAEKETRAAQKVLAG